MKGADATAVDILLFRAGGHRLGASNRGLDDQQVLRRAHIEHELAHQPGYGRERGFGS